VEAILSLRLPLQARSQRTLEAIVEATEVLLETKRFEQIPVAEIILRAGVSNGSFYARFPSKDALLPELYRRYNDELPARMAALRERFAGEASLAVACAILVDALATFFEGRRNLMRAITLYARTRPEELRPLLGERSGIVRQMIALFTPFHDQIEGDPEARIRAGLFIVNAGIREAVLFADAPMATVTAQNGTSIRLDAAQMLFAFLSRRESGR
jgi:AcrR family transcriptional regulator